MNQTYNLLLSDIIHTFESSEKLFVINFDLAVTYNNKAKRLS
jgi:TolB-like protein